MTRLNVKAVALAGGEIAAIICAGCSLVVAIAPEAARAITGWLFHMDLSNVRWSVSWSSVLTSVVGWAGLTALVAGGFAALYNRVVAGDPGARA